MKSALARLWPTFFSKLIGSLLYVLSSDRLGDASVVRVPIESPRTNLVILINDSPFVRGIRPAPELAGKGQLSESISTGGNRQNVTQIAVVVSFEICGNESCVFGVD